DGFLCLFVCVVCVCVCGEDVGRGHRRPSLALALKDSLSRCRPDASWCPHTLLCHSDDLPLNDRRRELCVCDTHTHTRHAIDTHIHTHTQTKHTHTHTHTHTHIHTQRY